MEGWAPSAAEQSSQCFTAMAAVDARPKSLGASITTASAPLDISVRYAPFKSSRGPTICSASLAMLEVICAPSPSDDNEAEPPGSESVDDALSLPELQSVYHLPSKEAARALNVSLSRLKRSCRVQNVLRWPHRKLSSLNNLQDTIRNDKSMKLLDKQRILQQIVSEISAVRSNPDHTIDPRLDEIRQAKYKLKYYHKAKHIHASYEAAARKRRQSGGKNNHIGQSNCGGGGGAIAGCAVGAGTGGGAAQAMSLSMPLAGSFMAGTAATSAATSAAAAATSAPAAPLAPSASVFTMASTGVGSGGSGGEGRTSYDLSTDGGGDSRGGGGGPQHMSFGFGTGGGGGGFGLCGGSGGASASNDPRPFGDNDRAGFRFGGCGSSFSSGADTARRAASMSWPAAAAAGPGGGAAVFDQSSAPPVAGFSAAAMRPGPPAPPSGGATLTVSLQYSSHRDQQQQQQQQMMQWEKLQQGIARGPSSEIIDEASGSAVGAVPSGPIAGWGHRAAAPLDGGAAARAVATATATVDGGGGDGSRHGNSIGLMRPSPPQPPSQSMEAAPYNPYNWSPQHHEYMRGRSSMSFSRGGGGSGFGGGFTAGLMGPNSAGSVIGGGDGVGGGGDSLPGPALAPLQHPSAGCLPPSGVVNEFTALAAAAAAAAAPAPARSSVPYSHGVVDTGCPPPPCCSSTGEPQLPNSAAAQLPRQTSAPPRVRDAAAGGGGSGCGSVRASSSGGVSYAGGTATYGPSTANLGAGLVDGHAAARGRFLSVDGALPMQPQVGPYRHSHTGGMPPPPFGSSGESSRDDVNCVCQCHHATLLSEARFGMSAGSGGGPPISPSVSPSSTAAAAAWFGMEACCTVPAPALGPAAAPAAAAALVPAAMPAQKAVEMCWQRQQRQKYPDPYHCRQHPHPHPRQHLTHIESQPSPRPPHQHQHQKQMGMPFAAGGAQPQPQQHYQQEQAQRTESFHVVGAGGGAESPPPLLTASAGMQHETAACMNGAFGFGGGGGTSVGAAAAIGTPFELAGRASSSGGGGGCSGGRNAGSTGAARGSSSGMGSVDQLHYGGRGGGNCDGGDGGGCSIFAPPALPDVTLPPSAHPGMGAARAGRAVTTGASRFPAPLPFLHRDLVETWATVSYPRYGASDTAAAAYTGKGWHNSSGCGYGCGGGCGFTPLDTCGVGGGAWLGPGLERRGSGSWNSLEPWRVPQPPLQPQTQPQPQPQSQPPQPQPCHQQPPERQEAPQPHPQEQQEPPPQQPQRQSPPLQLWHSSPSLRFESWASVSVLSSFSFDDLSPRAVSTDASPPAADATAVAALASGLVPAAGTGAAASAAAGTCGEAGNGGGCGPGLGGQHAGDGNGDGAAAAANGAGGGAAVAAASATSNALLVSLDWLLD